MFFEYKLAPKYKLLVEYHLNCIKSDTETYYVNFFDFSKFGDNKYTKIKYPKEFIIEIKK